MNPERKERVRTDAETGIRHTYGPYWKFASHEPCCVCGRRDGTPADHWMTVGTLGKDPANCLPVCTDHNDRHELGRDTWVETYGVEVEAVLREVWEKFKAARPEQADRLVRHLPNRRPE